MKALAVISGLAAMLWLLAGTQMIVTADDHAGAVWGLGVCAVGLVLLVLFTTLLQKMAAHNG